MKENYTYPAILDYSEEGYINISFPDFPNAVTCVGEGEDFVKEAQDVLALMIKDKLDSKEELPEEGVMPKAKDQQRIVYINIWLPYHTKQIKEVYTKKTLTIPVWLDILAKDANMNFSGILVEGLKAKLGICNTQS